ncbi:hypothetical protein [Helicobacter rodentium]|nr:hypothetical protein [Helicobacter rodentium]
MSEAIHNLAYKKFCNGIFQETQHYRLPRMLRILTMTKNKTLCLQH